MCIRDRDEGQPKELLYARRMTGMIARYAPDASEVAQLAVPVSYTHLTLPTSDLV